MSLAEQRKITLRQGHATPSTIVLRALPLGDSQVTRIVLRALHASPTTIVLRDPTTAPEGGGGFPGQFFGLRAFYGGSVHDLCLVLPAFGATGMGGIPMVDKNGTTYAIYLVETGDAQATPIRIRTSTGTKSIRRKT